MLRVSMTTRRVVLVNMGLSVLCVAGGLGQTQTGVLSSAGGGVGLRGGSFTANYGIAGSAPYRMPVVRDAPYSGQRTIESAQTLQDGTAITRTRPQERLFRDSAGRTRTERVIPRAPLQSNPGITLVEINDPVAECRYIVDSYNKVAHRVKAIAVEVRPVPPSNPGGSRGTAAPPAAAPVPGRPQLSTQSLGTQLMEGLLVEGTRATTTYPAGWQGNDRPIVATSETWFSTELRETVLIKTLDPRNGEDVTRLTDISRLEPDLTLFQIPPDYQIVDEEGPFSIKINVPPSSAAGK
jgi:hypothetical protein